MKRSHSKGHEHSQAPRSAREGGARAQRFSRRTPLQDRSRQRFERILDEAAILFAENGYDGTTTEAIAERAGTSIGSVYQFFPNKLAIFNAIGAQYSARIRHLFDTFMTPEAAQVPWFELLDKAIDAFAAFHRTEPGFRAIVLNWRVSADVVMNDDVNREFARRAEQVLALHAPRLSASRRALVATMIIEAVSAMIILHARRRDALGDAIVAETKTMLRRYLEPIVTEHGVTPRGRTRGTSKRHVRAASKAR